MTDDKDGIQKLCHAVYEYVWLKHFPLVNIEISSAEDTKISTKQWLQQNIQKILWQKDIFFIFVIISGKSYGYKARG